ncbi:MAG: Phytochrome-like protein cph1 [Syntrophorhabdaceae bacterium PtaU1.Bin034]|jgi:signal transduction histidine kinase|nr:MAG: Phytochrome-like protein cph1 [Syntrophorhabdaceae bacterium PtaU1.Bin034]
MTDREVPAIQLSEGSIVPEDQSKAILNILEDFAEEKKRLEETQRAMLNILEDFSEEKARLEETQRAMLNLLEDFDVERSKTEVANRELRESLESLRLAKEATETAYRELEAFSYSVSHDLRAPLRSVSGFSQVLLEDYFDKLDEEGKDSLRRIVAAAEKMGCLIDDLLNLSRLSRAAMNRERVNLSPLAKRISDRLRASSPGRAVKFIFPDELYVFGDERLLTVMLENLLDNAWKFTQKSEKAVIEFGLKRSANEKIFFVRDNGSGFDMAYIDKLFKPFQRLHRVEEFPGTGIGLATVKRIVGRHGGRVWIEGETGRGAVVYFTLQD